MVRHPEESRNRKQVEGIVKPLTVPRTGHSTDPGASGRETLRVDHRNKHSNLFPSHTPAAFWFLPVAIPNKCWTAREPGLHNPCRSTSWNTEQDKVLEWNLRGRLRIFSYNSIREFLCIRVWPLVLKLPSLKEQNEINSTNMSFSPKWNTSQKIFCFP